MIAEITTKEHPILFSTPMVQAILEGRKTQTRRIVKYPKSYKLNELLDWEIRPHEDGSNQFSFWWDSLYTLPTFSCPYGKVGDALWVRERFSRNEGGMFGYYANSERLDLTEWTLPIKWKPSIHMPRAACRIRLRITSIRVERLQDISQEDALAEGVKHVIDKVTGYCGYNYLSGGYNLMTTPYIGFVSLWQSINGAESWNSNPWVWCISFKKVSQ